MHLLSCSTYLVFVTLIFITMLPPSKSQYYDYENPHYPQNGNPPHPQNGNPPHGNPPHPQNGNPPHGNPPHPQNGSPPHSQNGNPHDCQGTEDPRCVCNMAATLEYLNEMASVSYAQVHREPNIVSLRIESYQCVRPTHLPATLKLKLNSDEGADGRHFYYKTRRRMRAKRSLRLGWDQGQGGHSVDNRSSDIHSQAIALPEFRSMPSNSTILRRARRQIALGYPSNELFYEILPKLETRSNHFYIPLGGSATLPCGTGENSQNVMEGGDGADGKEGSTFKKIYEWSHSDKRPVFGPEISVNPKNGDLAFKSVSLSDSDLYSCEVSHTNHHETDGEPPPPPSEPYYQQLDIVAEPVQWLRFAAEYYTPHCSRDELTLINSHVVSWIHAHVCFFCPVRNHSVTCISDDVEWNADGESALPSPDHKRVLIRLAVATLGLERKMGAFPGYSDACPLPCVELLHVKILQIVRDSLEKLFRLHIEVEVSQGEGSSEVTNYVPGSLSNDLVIACPSGFFAEHKLCFPCSPGQFSPNGNSECFSCEIGSFQPTPGSGMCLLCPEGYSTIDPGSVGEFDCKIGVVASGLAGRLYLQYYPWSLYLLIVLAILGVLLLLACIIPCLCPKSWMGRCCAGISCCGPDPDFDENVVKGRKNYERMEYSEDEEGGENERTRTQTTRKIVDVVEETETDEVEEDALDEVRILPAQVLVDDNNRVVEVDVVGEVDARRSGNIIIKDHFLYQPGRREEQVQNYVTTKTKNVLLTKAGSKPKIPKPPPLPATTSYWASTPKNSKLQQQTTFGSFKPKKYPRNLGRYEVIQQVPTPSPTIEKSKFRQVEMDPTPEDQRSKNVYIFSTDEDQQSQSQPRYHSVKEFTRKLDNSKGARKSNKVLEEPRPKKNVKIYPYPKTRIIPSRAEEKAAYYDDDYIVGHALLQGASDDEVDGGRGDGDAQALVRRSNFPTVGHVSIRPTSTAPLRIEKVPSKSKLRPRSPTSSEFDINAPINVKKIATKLEKRRRFSAGLMNDKFTTGGKIPPGAFTYTPPLLPKATGARREY